MTFIEDMQQDALAAKEAAEQYGSLGLTQLGKEALDLEQLIQSHEAEAKRLKKDLEKIMRYAIPQALAEVGIDEFGVRHEGGEARIKLETKVVGSLRNAPDEEAAVTYLEEHGLAGVVKSTIELDFTEDERDMAEQLLPQLEQLAGRHPLLSRSINAQTLMAFVRQKLQEDPTFDYGKVGITAFPQAKFTKRR